MKDIYSMTEKDFYRQGVEDGQVCHGNVDKAFDKLVSEIDVIAYFQMGAHKSNAYRDGFKRGYSMNPGDEPDNVTRDYNDEACD